MNKNDRLEMFLKLQNKNISFDNISKEIGISPVTLRKFLNRMGYKSENGKYVSSINENQISFEDLSDKNIKSNSKKKNVKLKKDRKINLTQDDLDKLCEVYDWYLQVKDLKSMKPKKTSNKKDVIIEDIEIKELKGTNIKVEKNTWEEFERLCSNSDFSKQQIITQALKDFMKGYKHLL